MLSICLVFLQKKKKKTRESDFITLASKLNASVGKTTEFRNGKGDEITMTELKKGKTSKK